MIVYQKYIGTFIKVGPREGPGLSRECVLRIPSVIVKGD